MLEFGWYGFLQLLGALALLIYGLKVMSEGVQRIASIQLRQSLQKVTQNKISSFLTGFFTTALVQSSSATTVLTVSFVNAGILTLRGAAGIIIGANIGIIVTIWLVTILGFEFNLFTICLPLIGLSLPFLYVRNGKYRHWAETLIGFSILLLAIQFMKSIVPELQKHAEFMEFLSRLSGNGVLSIIVFLGIGILLAALIQSSSAAIALTMTMCLNGWIPFDVAIAMIMGENIGTTLTTEIASWVGNDASKKAARIHVLFNITGVLFFLPLIPFLIPLIEWVVIHIFKMNTPVTEPLAMPVGLAVFYTCFNFICASFYLSFPGTLIKLASKTLKPSDKTNTKLNFIDTGTNSADLSFPVAMQEMVHTAMRIKNLNTSLNRITHYASASDFQEQIQVARSTLQITRENQTALGRYLIELVEDKSSLITSKQITGLLQISVLFDHITDHYAALFDLTIEKKNRRIWFGPTQRSNLLFQIHDADVKLKQIIFLLQSNQLHKASWSKRPTDQDDKYQLDLENEKELMDELSRGELKIDSMPLYYNMSQLINTINHELKAIILEFFEKEPETRLSTSVESAL